MRTMCRRWLCASAHTPGMLRFGNRPIAARNLETISPMTIPADFHADFAPAAPPAALPRDALRLSCVVPAHNEDANLEHFVRALVQAV